MQPQKPQTIEAVHVAYARFLRVENDRRMGLLDDDAIEAVLGTGDRGRISRGSTYSKYDHEEREHSIETRAKMSASQRERMATPEARMEATKALRVDLTCDRCGRTIRGPGPLALHKRTCKT